MGNCPASQLDGRPGLWNSQAGYPGLEIGARGLASERAGLAVLRCAVASPLTPDLPPLLREPDGHLPACSLSFVLASFGLAIATACCARW